MTNSREGSLVWLARSLLPLPATSYAQESEYNILGTLKGLEADSVHYSAGIKIFKTSTIIPISGNFLKALFLWNEEYIDVQY